MSEWVRAAAVADIRVGGARSFAWRDKRCPHQGYALVRGDVRDGQLTCAWHNWKFDLRTGTCRHGGENVRTYPVRVAGGQVYIDVADPPAEVIRPELFASLAAAMEDLDVGRVARDAL